MASRKDDKPVIKKADSKIGATTPADTKPGAAKPADVKTVATKKSGDYIATSATHREWLADADSTDAWRDTRATVLRVNIRRPDDLFVAELSLFNLKIVSGASPTLRRIDSNEVATLVLKLPPQSFGEQAYLESTAPEVKNTSEAADFVDKEFQGKPGYDNKNTYTASSDASPSPGAAMVRISGPSRLAFSMPSSVSSIPYTLDAILNAARTWPLRHSLTAVAEPGEDTNVTTMSAPGSGELLSNLINSDDFANTVQNVKKSLQELTVSAPTDKRNKSLGSLAKQFDGVVNLGSVGVNGKYGYSDSAAMPLLPLIAAPYRPTEKMTALELPYRIFTSPVGSARFTHRTTPLTHVGRSELWHTRLTSTPGNAGADSPTRLRAIWSEDYIYPDIPGALGKPFRMPLDAQDRRMLVQLTSGFGEQKANGQDYIPLSAKADRVILSALGGLLDTEGNWNERPESVDVQQWRHLMSLGRDHYVRVVYAGFLLPFGHAASLIKVTERKFEPADKNDPLKNRVAVLRQRFFIVVRESVKVFEGSLHFQGGHNFPFTSVEILTRVTPNLQDPENQFSLANETQSKLYADVPNYEGGLTPRQCFWPMMEARVGGDFRFDIAAIDRDGRRSTFAMPLLFMSEVGNTQSIKKKDGFGSTFLIDSVKKAYNIEGPDRREVDMNGASICFAPPDANSAGDPRFPTKTLKFRAGKTRLANSSTEINTYPEVDDARVALLAAQRVLGRDIAPVLVKYAPLYANNGFSGTNTGEVFLEIQGAPFNMSFGSSGSSLRTDVVGAVVSPTTAITGMSRRLGLASDLDNVKSNVFDPATFLGDAKILGSIKLADFVPRVESLEGTGAPKLTTRDLPASGNKPARLEAQYDWQTTLSGKDEGLLLYKADGGASPFRLRAITTTVVGDPDSAVSTTDSAIGNFKVNLFGFVALWFRELNFKTTKGQKPEVSVNLHPVHAVEFGGALEFVNQLKDLLPGNGFCDPSALQVTASGIEAKYSLTVPKVQVGIFDLSGLSVGARFTLPFDVRPMEVGFNFAERENPFSLTVSLLGGGGFVAIGIGADGVREIEAAIEAGARLSLDLGVASGSVEIKAGIYFHWLEAPDPKHNLVQLTGYVRVHGEMDVMGIISISITFNLSLSYEKDGSRSVISGEASVTVEIEVLVFSGEVTVRCRREFVGSEADPKFAQLVPATTTWSSYCSAFAEA